MGFNFDTAMHKRTLAASKGIGSKEWVEFAHMMFDEFPALYETARKMTVHQHDLERERNLLLYAAKEARRAIASAASRDETFGLAYEELNVAISEAES